MLKKIGTIEIEIDTEAVRYISALIIVVGFILVIGNSVAGGLAVLMYPEPKVDFRPLARTEPPTPTFKELADDAVIFSSSKSVIGKKDELEKEKRDFIFADLAGMKLSLYQKGDLIKTFDIKGRGKEGSFFETPNGFYKIRLKEKKHFSTIGKVWMPWSMHFFGNYFIHGIPYYPDGTFVADAFSGGCIRLSVEDSKELYALTKDGTAVLTYSEEPEAPIDFQYYQKVAVRSPVQPPALSAVSALAADFETGQILFEKEKTKQFPIASISKLMTGLVALETINRFKPIKVTKEALATEGDSAHFTAGDEFKAEDLLYPLILSSSNDAATAYQNETWNFIEQMNQKASAIGMARTHYEDSSGLTPKNISTPEDIFKLLQYIYAHKKPLFVLSSLKEYTLTTFDKKKKIALHNVNWPRDDERFIAGKSGSTPEARQSMVGVYKVKFSEYGDRPIAIVVLGSHDRVSDVSKIEKYLEQNFVYGNVYADGLEKPKPLSVGASLFEALSN